MFARPLQREGAGTFRRCEVTKDAFVALCTEEGLSTLEAEACWGARPTEDLEPEGVRSAARKTLPTAKLLRKLLRRGT